MTDTSHHQSPDMGNALYDEAADWFARMRGPDADLQRAEFEAWLVRGAVHRAAYNRVAEIFTDSGRVDAVSTLAARPESWPLSRWTRLSVAIALVVFAAAALFYVQHSFLSQGSATQSLASAVGEIRRVRLSDGSVILLDTDSLLNVTFSGSERRLHLVRGRARFDVAHEARPFKVSAGDGTVTARGTLFDVQINSVGMASVILLRGAVDVAMTQNESVAPQRLHPGQRTSYRHGFEQAQPVAVTPSSNWTKAMGDYRDVPLAQVLTEANRYSAVSIVILDPQDAKRRVSGIFALNNPDRLSSKLAELFQLDRRIEADRIILIPRKRPEKKTYVPD